MSQNLLLLLTAILNKNPPLAHRWPSLGSLSFGWQAFVGQHWPNVGKSTDHATNSHVCPMLGQCWQNLPTMRPPANIGPMAECYLGTSLTGGPPLAAMSQQML